MFAIENEEGKCVVSNSKLDIHIFEDPNGGVAIDVFGKKDHINKGWLIFRKHKTKEVRFQEKELE